MVEKNGNGKRIKLRVALPTAFVAFILICGLVGVIISYLLNVKYMQDMAEIYIRKVANHAVEKTMHALQPISRIAKVNADVIGMNRLRDDFHQEFDRIALSELAVYPGLFQVYYGDVNGNFIMNARGEDGASSGLRIKRLDDSKESGERLARAADIAENAPNGDARVADLISPVIETTRLERNESGEVVASRKDEEYIYDPRLRPWYEDAVSEKRAGWTGFYRFSESGGIGITHSVPVFHKGEFAGVTAVDIVAEDLAAFFRNQKVAETGRVFILDRKGGIVGLSEELGEGGFQHIKEALKTEKPGKDAIILDAYDALLKIAEEIGHAELAGSHELFFKFKKNGVKYWGGFQYFPKDSGLDWVIGVVAPQDEFVGELKKNSVVSLMASLSLVLLVALVALVFTREVTNPIKMVALEAEKIKNFELRKPVLIKSIFKEIDQLTTSFAGMKIGLKSFQKYVPSELVRYLIDSGQEAVLGGKNREMTIWFSDIADFTTISETMEPQELVEHLGGYLGEMSRTVMDADGTVDKYIGDAVMAFWNAPAQVDDHAFAACKAALACKKLEKELRPVWEEKKLPAIKTRIGINTGVVVVGNMGSEERLNYTVIGDPVNVASRLEGLGKVYGVEIVIGETTAGLVDGLFVTRFLDKVAVKGKSRGLKIYELVCEKNEASAETGSFIQLYEAGVRACHHRNWDDAEENFNKAMSLRPGDKSCSLFINRVGAFRSAPPPDDWDGTFVLNFK